MSANGACSTLEDAHILDLAADEDRALVSEDTVKGRDRCFLLRDPADGTISPNYNGLTL